MASGLPGPAGWPCQAKVRTEHGHERLVAFMYRLLRDGASAPSDVEEHAIAVGVHEGTRPVHYTNAHLEAYARSLSNYLLEA